MCSLCDDLEKSGDDRAYESCQDCGFLICFDVKGGDDVLQRAYVTASGDLFCRRCGSAHDRAEEEQDEAEGYYEPPEI